MQSPRRYGNRSRGCHITICQIEAGGGDWCNKLSGIWETPYLMNTIVVVDIIIADLMVIQHNKPILAEHTKTVLNNIIYISCICQFDYIIKIEIGNTFLNIDIFSYFNDIKNEEIHISLY